LGQARQIFVFAQAALLGRLVEGDGLARAGFDFLVAHCRHPEGGWRFRVARDGAPLDDTRDLYAQAFVLYALAWMHRLAPDSAARTLAEETAAYLDDAMAHSAGGYREGIDAAGRPVAGPRRQNPHMHLFEALLEWHAASGDPIWIERAKPLAALMASRFCVGGTLREYFSDDLSPAPGEQGRLVEPGHHYEWTWLLRRYQNLSGDVRYAEHAANLYAFAQAYGIDPKTDGAVDAVDSEGKAVQRSRRFWPQTEAIKAHAARLDATGDPQIRSRIDRQVNAFLREHIQGAPKGGWREHIGEDDALLVAEFPASSLYHVTLAVAELDRRRQR
jgi:mannose/cellobiose epimerase-like protein (N-acyl-D-glucosamine 2-epimerase family)